MRALGWREATLAILPLAGALVPHVAAGQPGFYLIPSFSLAEVYDDNLFSTPSRRESDVISRQSPGIQVGYRSEPLTLLGGYTFDAEIFAVHPELNTAQARQEASLSFRSRAARPATFAFDGRFTETQTPGELNEGTLLAVGRVRAQRISFRPSVGYEFDRLTAGTVDYMFTEDELSRGVTTRGHTAGASLDRRFTARDTGSLVYSFSRFDFDETDSSTSHALTLGWRGAITPLTEITLRGGARVTEGSVGPEVLGSVRRRLERGEVSFTYSRSQTTAIGQAGTVNTERFEGAAIWRPLEVLLIQGAPSFARSTRAGLEAKVYGVNLDATYRITGWLSLQGSYAFSFQEGTLEATPLSGAEILRNVIILRLTATYPFRLY